MSQRRAACAEPERMAALRPSCPPLPCRPPLTAPAPHRCRRALSFPGRCGLSRPLLSEQGHLGHDTPAAAIARSRSQWRGPGTPIPRRVTRCVAEATARRTPYSWRLDQERGTRHLAMGCPPMGYRAPLSALPDWAAGCALFTYADRPTGPPRPRRPEPPSGPGTTPAATGCRPRAARPPVGRLCRVVLGKGGQAGRPW